MEVRRRISLQHQEEWVAYLCVLPWIIGFLAFTGGPILASLALSFTKYPILKAPSFVGIENYKTMFLTDDLVLHSLKVTAIYTGAAVPLSVVMGYLLAMLLNQRVRGLSFWRTAFYMPSIVPVVSSAYLFAWLLNPQLGLVNTFLSYLGIKGPMWFGSKEWALPAFILMSLWGVGGTMILYLAALQGVPTALYDAAKVDGCNAWQTFWNVTLPMTSPVILFTFLTSVIGSFQIFSAGYIITGGGPGNATLFYILHLYRNGWQYGRMGYASAMAWILFLILMALTALTFRVSGSVVYYGGAEEAEL